jgi:hypothetical protein
VMVRMVLNNNVDFVLLPETHSQKVKMAVLAYKPISL